ncbi:MAG TPA: winged helix-turn-helix domain-containing protein [Pyrinomonadaceae bacterium]
MSKIKVRVNRKGPESLTRQITNQLTGLINTGVLAAGEMLPSERTLADSLGVARNVVRRSYDYLMSGELVEGQGRRGRRVRGASASGRSTGAAAAAASASGKKRGTGSKGSKKSSSGKGSAKSGKSSSKGRGRKSR